MAKAVFLSYASQDAEGVARVRDALEAAGIEVWFDQAELKGGDAWDAAIRGRIKECTLFVPVVSAATDARDEGYFRLEWKLAIDRSHLIAEDKPFLLPVMLEGTSQQAARVPGRFREVQWSRASSPEDVAAFARHVLRLLDGAAAAATHVERLLASNAGPSQPSIAVLPFVNMSRDEENEYFADGLSEELLNVLARIRGLRVASRTSAFSFKGKDVQLASVARQLGVATILEGSVRKAGKRVRITAQLIDAATDSHLWSQAYDRDLDDILAVQDDIARAVVVELRRALLGEGSSSGSDAAAKEVRAAALGRSADAEAHRLYLQGRFFLQRVTREGMERSLEFLRQAIARDPGFAAGWTGLSTVYWSLSAHGLIPPAEGFAQARTAALRALELEPGFAEAHVCYARVLARDRDWQGAGAELERALALAPGDALVLRAVARHAATMGRLEEAIGHLRRAVELDPLHFANHFNLGGLSAFAGHLDEAEAAVLRARELNPAGGAWHTGLAIVHLLRGNASEAAEESRQEPNADMGLTLLAMAEHTLGHRERADEALATLIANHGHAAYNIAMVHAWRGETERAFESLERAFATNDPSLADLLRDPFIASLRKDPRWPALVRRAGLPDVTSPDHPTGSLP